MPTNIRDPRTIITPHAFGISPELLGTPLARPWSRLWALMIDLVVVAVLTTMLGGVTTFVWGVVALFLLWIALQRTAGTRKQAVSALLRISAGCLGAAILGAVVVVWLITRLASDEGERPGPGSGVAEALPEEVMGGGPGGARGLEILRAVFRGLAGRGPLADAGSPDEAEAAALELLDAMAAAGLNRQDRLDLLEEMTPSDAPWAEDAEGIYREALERWEEAHGGAVGEPAEDTVEAASSEAESEGAAEEVAAMSDARVLEVYAELLRGDSAGADVPEGARARLLRRRAIELVASDTLGVLSDRVAQLRRTVDEETARRERAEHQAEQGGNALVGLLRDIWDQLGSAIGLWSIYFTVVTTLLAGQTVGKRLMGIRVLRLDGEPINAWAAFERAGGYVAGVATGLLGFAQVFWDPNRQCVHDKIVGTVVIDDRAEKVPGSWQEAWTEAPGGGTPATDAERNREVER